MLPWLFCLFLMILMKNMILVVLEVLVVMMVVLMTINGVVSTDDNDGDSQLRPRSVKEFPETFFF